MEKKLTSTDIVNIADKVMNLIRDEVRDNDNLAETVLFECEKRITLKRKVSIAGPVEY